MGPLNGKRMAAVVPDRDAAGRGPITGGKALGSITTLPGAAEGPTITPGAGIPGAGIPGADVAGGTRTGADGATGPGGG